MNTPSLYERIHWWVFNKMGKAVGLGIGIMSGLVSLSYLGGLLGITEKNELPGILLIFLIPTCILGFMSLKAKPYYPEKYKDWYARNKKHV